MFKVKNISTGKIVKDAISGKELVFDRKEDATRFAESMTANAAASDKPFTYAAI